jgi:hypothetical protein
MFYYYYFPGNNIWINAVWCFSISVIIATVSFYGFEIHFLKLKRYFETASWYEKAVLPLDSNHPVDSNQPNLKTEF